MDLRNQSIKIYPHLRGAPSLLILAFAITILDRGFANTLLEEVRLTAGDSTTLHFVDGADIQVSRRGIVDLVHRGNGAWLVTALQTGIVSLSASDNNQKYHKIIRITPRSEHMSTSTTEIPDWICGIHHVSCDHEARIVNGRIHDGARFLQAKTWCFHNDCRFLATLDDKTKDTLEQSIRQILPKVESVRLSLTGALRLDINCDGEQNQTKSLGLSPKNTGAFIQNSISQEIRAILQSQFEEQDIVIACYAGHESQAYRLETKIVRFSKSILANLGFDTMAELSIFLPRFQLDASLRSKLDNAERSRQIETIGEPAIRLIPGRLTEVRSGGEFLASTSTNRSSHAKSAWKPFGLSLRAEVNPRASDIVRLTYDLSLSARDEDGINLQKVSGDLDLRLGEPTIAAALDLIASDHQVRTQTIMAQIPIVGPLFSFSANGRNHSQVVAWFQVSRDEARGLRSPEPAWPDVKIAPSPALGPESKNL